MANVYLEEVTYQRGGSYVYLQEAICHGKLSKSATLANINIYLTGKMYTQGLI